MSEVHTKFVAVVEEQFVRDGYTILRREAEIEGMRIKGKQVKVDLLVEKDGKVIPVECGYIKPPVMERVAMLRERFGVFIHVRYGQERRELIRHGVTQGIGRIVNNRAPTKGKMYNKYWLYIPQDVAKSSLFPFDVGESVRILVYPESQQVIIEKAEAKDISAEKRIRK